MITRDPDHSYRFAQKFKAMEAMGRDIVGETRTVDAMVERGSRILDAGCGYGRHAAAMAAAGHTVVGVDVDPVLIGMAKEDYPQATFLHTDLAELDLPAAGIEANFDAILSAGNVLAFLHPSTRVEVLRRLRQHLAPAGRIITGFSTGRNYEFTDYFAHVEEAGLRVDHRFSTWNLHPFDEDSQFLVAILSAA